MITFFNQYFGRHLVAQTDDPVADAQRALSSNHRMLHPKKKDISRLSSGWAIIRPGRSTLQFELQAPGIDYSRMTCNEAFLAELQNWDGTPRLFLVFENKTVSVNNLFRTFDPRQVRICGPRGVETFDFTRPPTPASSPTHKILWKMLQAQEKSTEKGAA